MKKTFSVDRFEGQYAVVVGDDGEVISIERKKIPELSEGDVFSASFDGAVLSNITLMEGEKERRLMAANSRLAKFKSRSNS